MISRYLLIILAFAVLSLSGCADRNGQHVRDGREYGTTGANFKGRWWDYYERGRSFSDGRFYTEAIADFKKAVAENDNDQWQAQTDEMRAMDYFPHREMGVVYFQRKQYGNAISELKNSIQSAPSAKGYYFLNKARAAKLREEARDMFSPELQLDGSSSKRLTNSLTYMIKGVAVDDTYVAAIQVGDIRIPVEVASKQRVFAIEVPLTEGDNIIRTIATDLVGKSTEQNLEIYCDRSGPTVEILQMEGEGESRSANGVVSDTGGLKSLTVNGKPWKITGTSSAYSFKFALQKGGVTLVATDRAGNVTRAVLSEEKLEDDPLMHPRVARLEPSLHDHQSSMVVSDAHLPLIASTQDPATDTDPPFIKLEDFGPDHETYEDSILLEGSIVDSSPIHLVSVNGSPIPSKNGKKLYFSFLKELAEGDNEFHFAAIDSHGNRSEKIIKIHRKVKNIFRTDSRLSVAILPFARKGETSPISELIYDQMISSFKQQKRFNVVGRHKIDTVLQKLTLSRTDLADQDRAVEFGRIIAADTVLVGDLIESAGSVEIIGRLIDTETNTILAANDIFGEDKSMSSLNTLLDDLAVKFKHDFPLFEGILIEVKDDEVVINIGSRKHIRPGQRLICYRKGIETRHPVTGKIIGAEPEILGSLTVTEVSENSSKARPQNRRGVMKIYDQVIAR